MPAVGFLKRTRSLRSRRAEDTFHGSSELVPPRDTSNDEAPYEWRRMGSPPYPGTAPKFNQLLSPAAFKPAAQKQHDTTGDSFLGSPKSPIGDFSLDGNMIGLPLGGPNESSLPFSLPEDHLQESQARLNTTDSMSTTQSYGCESTIKSEMEKPKMLKWKSFGGLFGKKAAVSPSARVYQVQPSSSDVVSEQGRSRHLALEQIRSSEDQFTRAQKPLVLPSQQRKVTQKPSPVATSAQKDHALRSHPGVRKYPSEVNQAAPPSKPELYRSQTCPMAEQRDKSPLPPPKDVNIKPETTTLQCDGGSLLEVEIPSIHLERYSVMFENLLQHPPSSTLLVRRQGQPKEGKSKEAINEKTELSREAHRLPLSETPPGSLARPLSLSSSRSFSPQNAPTSARTLPPGRSPLHRSLTSPGLISPKRGYVASPLSKPTDPGRDWLETNDPTGSLAASRRQNRTPHLHQSGHSRTSTVTSFHTAPESQPTEPVPRPSLHQQSMPIPTSNVQGGQPLRSSISGVLPIVSPIVPTSVKSMRGRTAEIQDGKQKRNASVANLEIAASVLVALPDEHPQELKPSPPRRVPKNGHISRTSPAQIPTAELAKQAAKAAALSIQDSREHRAGSTLATLPLSSHPPSPVLKGKYSGSAGTRPKISRLKSSTTSAPATPLSAPQAPNTDRITNAKPAHQRGPKPTAFSPPPSNSSSSVLPRLPSGLISPEELKSAAEISIARQISISRRQRELLAPLAPRYARQPMQPMLVDVTAGAHTARKSRHLVLEHV